LLNSNSTVPSYCLKYVKTSREENDVVWVSTLSRQLVRLKVLMRHCSLIHKQLHMLTRVTLVDYISGNSHSLFPCRQVRSLCRSPPIKQDIPLDREQYALVYFQVPHEPYSITRDHSTNCRVYVVSTLENCIQIGRRPATHTILDLLHRRCNSQTSYDALTVNPYSYDTVRVSSVLAKSSL
jgi:hypothetical protein